MKVILNAFKNRTNVVIFFLITIISFSVFLYLPIKTVPGNDLIFQLSILSFKDLVLFIILSLLVGLSFVLQIALWKKKRGLKTTVKGVSSIGLSSFGGVIASVFGTATCASCLTALFGFLGIGTIFSLIEYRSYIMIGAIALITFSIYLTSRQLKKGCKSCEAPK